MHNRSTYLNRRHAARIAWAWIGIFCSASSGIVDASAATDKCNIALGGSRSAISPIAGILITPHWVPYIDADCERGDFFARAQSGVGYKWINRSNLNIGPLLGYQYGRREAADSRYRGLGNVDGAAVPSIFGEWLPFDGALDIYAQAGRANSGANGWNYTAEMTLGLPLAPALNGFIDVLGMGGDNRVAQAYYGVTPRQSSRSSYAVYAPGGGFFDASAVVGIEYQCSYHWKLTANIGALRYTGSVANSPLIERGTDVVGNVFATYRF